MTVSRVASSGQALRLLVLDIWQNGLPFHKWGYGSAEAVRFTFLVLGFTLIQFRLVRSQEE